MKTWERILRDLRDYDWVCGTFWLARFTPTYAQRISLDLKPRGYQIISRPCKRHGHKGGVYEYRLVGEPAPEQLTMRSA